MADVTLAVEDDSIVVTGSDELETRRARLFFRSVLGAESVDGGWRCPRRNRSLSSLVLRVNDFLEGEDLEVVREGLADREVERELQRRRSFERTREAASQFKRGDVVLDRTAVLDTLQAFGWSDERTLQPHQVEGTLHALIAGNAANFSVPGSGKTVVALATAATHLASRTIDLVLVVGPLACFRPWEGEAAAALPGILRPRRVRGSAASRRAMYERAQRHDLLLLSYATAAADRSAIIELCQDRSVMLVVDESHRIKRFRGGVWAPALMRIAEHARVRMILSGTPMPQTGRDLYSQLNVLWPDRQLTGPPETFASRVDRQFRSVLRDVGPFIARTPKEALGLPPYEIVRHDVDMNPIQAEVYELVLNHFRRRLEDAESWADKLDVLRRGRPIRLLQAASNPDLFNRDDNYYRIPRMDTASPTLMDRLASYQQRERPTKHVAALSLVSDVVRQDGKVVCWSNFLMNLDQFSRLVRERLPAPIFQVDGRVPTDDEVSNDAADRGRENPTDLDSRERIIDRFLQQPGPAVLVTNPQSCSESISLHRSCHTAVYLDRTYDCAQFLQSIDRIHRLGLPVTANVQLHIVRATFDGAPAIDHLVDQSLLAKEGTMRELLEGAVLRPIAQGEDPVQDAEGDRQDLESVLRYLLGEQLQV
jgi:SNF2 family DNA or RNA helicase